MSMQEYVEGILVEHPKFGLGKILTIVSGKAHVHFRDDTQDSRHLALASSVFKVASVQSDLQLDSLPAFEDGKFATKRKRVLWSDAIEAFRGQFPGGFSDPAYLGTGTVQGKGAGERGCKWAAHELWVEQLGEGRLEDLASRGELEEISKRALAVIAKANLLGRLEVTALREGLAAPETAQRFFEALSALLEQPPQATTFEALVDAILALPAESARAKVASWPVLTVLPFLARPDRFMFLKPEISLECAERMRFDLQYSADLDWMPYESLLELSDFLLEKLRPYGAQDFIDVQSFMWAISKY